MSGIDIPQQEWEVVPPLTGPPGPPGPKGEKGEKGEPGSGSEPLGPAGGDLEGEYPNPLLAAALKALIEAALQPGDIAGGDLAGTYPNPTIKAALKSLIEAALQPGDAAGGDLSGTYPNPTIKAALKSLIEEAMQPGDAAGGDLTGTYPNPKLSKPVIAGGIKSNGEILVGTGFTSEKTGTGTYKITLTTELATEGIPVANTTNATATFCVVEGPSKKVFLITTAATVTGAATDAAFTFMIKAT